jgi:hypothetical protein
MKSVPEYCYMCSGIRKYFEDYNVEVAWSGICGIEATGQWDHIGGALTPLQVTRCLYFPFLPA